jgi:hypothetical protein
MEAKHFEALSRRMGAACGRRGALLVLTSALLAPVLPVGPRAALAGIPVFHCKPPGKRCDKDQKCCSGNCRKGICSCVKKGKPCWAPLEGALCCSQRCSDGKCA